jgi:hypothetical protein
LKKGLESHQDTAATKLKNYFNICGYHICWRGYRLKVTTSGDVFETRRMEHHIFTHVLFVAVIELKLLAVSFLFQSTAFSHLAVHITVLVKERHRIFVISHTLLYPGLVWINVKYFVSLLVCQPC